MKAQMIVNEDITDEKTKESIRHGNPLFAHAD